MMRAGNRGINSQLTARYLGSHGVHAKCGKADAGNAARLEAHAQLPASDQLSDSSGRLSILSLRDCVSATKRYAGEADMGGAGTRLTGFEEGLSVLEREELIWCKILISFKKREGKEDNAAQGLRSIYRYIILTRCEEST
jgi:hypothetical protein